MVKSLTEGELVHLIDKRGRRYQLILKAGASFSYSRGIISHDDLIGVEEGSGCLLYTSDAADE